MKLNEAIELYRKTDGLTQSDLAELVGVSRATVNAWEAGRSLPRPRYILKLSRILKVDLRGLYRKEI